MDENCIIRNGQKVLVSTYTVDFGPKNGAATVTVYDPNITEEAQEKRRRAIVAKCQELMRLGLM